MIEKRRSWALFENLRMPCVNWPGYLYVNGVLTSGRVAMMMSPFSWSCLWCSINRAKRGIKFDLDPVLCCRLCDHSMFVVLCLGWSFRWVITSAAPPSHGLPFLVATTGRAWCPLSRFHQAVLWWQASTRYAHPFSFLPAVWNGAPQTLM